MILIEHFGGRSSLPPKKKEKFKGIVIKRPSLKRGPFWEKRLITMIQSSGAIIDPSFLGKNCDRKSGMFTFRRQC